MFENNVSDRCPLCQRKMKPKGSSLICEDCGYVQHVPGNASTYEHSAPMYNYDVDHAQTTGTAGRQTSGQANGKIGSVIMIFAVMIIIFAAVVMFFNVARMSSVEKSVYQTVVEEDDVAVEYHDEWGDIKSHIFDYEDAVDEGSVIPESGLFVAFVEEVFGKGCEEITQEEYNSITYLSVDDYEDVIEYAINDGEKKQYTYDSSLYGYSDDIRCFPGLKALDYNGKTFYEGDLEGLTELEEIRCANSPQELSELLDNPEKIVTLELYDNYYMETLEGIENFTSLKELYIDATYLEQLTGLDRLENLEVLEITYGNSLVSFTEIGKLSSLKKFTISSYALKNLTIMENMKNLEEVSVSNTQITDISVLSQCAEKLKKLELIDNYDVSDYSSLGDMKNLEALSLSCNYDGILPDFSKMSSLKTLFIDGASDVTKLSTAKNLTELTLEYCTLDDLTVLSGMTSLKRLTMKSMYSYYEDLHALTALTGLEKLDLTSFSVSGNVEEIFALPNLKELILEDAYIGLDCDNVKGNDKLEVLNLNGARIYCYEEPEEDSYWFYDYDYVDLTEKSEMFKKFPNLTELYLEGQELENIEFAASLKNLRILDITDNNVSSLKPLAELSKLEYVWCAGNTIGNDGGQGDKLIYE